MNSTQAPSAVAKVSAQTIARWNALLEEDGKTSNLKRKRGGSDEDNEMADPDQDDDDDVSLVSRTPTPDPMDIDKYDEYVKGIPHEVITAETRIKSSNKGFAMLAKLGWSEGQPLGLSEDGRLDPVPFQVKQDSMGLGKINQDYSIIESTVSQRRELDSERQQKESEEQRRNREDAVARRTALATQISSTLRPFYCSLCDKQFLNVAQYDEHTNSYAHHHKARLRDMQANARAVIGKEDLDRRKEKERRREEKELRKLAKAQGVNLAKSSPAQVSCHVSLEDTKMEDPRSSTWAPVTSPSQRPSSFKPTGWSSAGSSAAVPSQGLQPQPPQPPGGWTPPPPDGPPSEPPLPPPPPPLNDIPPPPFSPPAPPSDLSGDLVAGNSPLASLDRTSSSNPASHVGHKQTPPKSKTAGLAEAAPARSSWQSFQKSRFRR